MQPLMPLFRTQLPIEIKPGETLTRQNHELSTGKLSTSKVVYFILFRKFFFKSNNEKLLHRFEHAGNISKQRMSCREPKYCQSWKIISHFFSDNPSECWNIYIYFADQLWQRL